MAEDPVDACSHCTGKASGHLSLHQHQQHSGHTASCQVALALVLVALTRFVVARAARHRSWSRTQVQPASLTDTDPCSWQMSPHQLHPSAQAVAGRNANPGRNRRAAGHNARVLHCTSRSLGPGCYVGMWPCPVCCGAPGPPSPPTSRPPP